MDRRRLVRSLAVSIPADLRSLRGKVMLESLCEVLGVEETGCPACRGTGWLDRRRLESCPICCGFREVPEALAQWFRIEMHRRAEGRGIERSRPPGIRSPVHAETQ